MRTVVQIHSEAMRRNALPDAILGRHKREARAVALGACQNYGCRIEAVYAGNDHRPEVVNARRHVIHELRQRGWTQALIARVLRLDRSTVLYALRKIPIKPQERIDRGPIPIPDESGIWAI